jgi:flavin reductase (DIM6/NTAB) family NADH-FMN oxidoreductase RutF
MSIVGPGELQDAFRQVMSSVCSPVSVVTGLDDAGPHGTTVSAFASLSLEPPMVLVALDRGSDLLALVRRTERFGLNVLSSAQAELALTFARKGGAAKFDTVAWEIEWDVPRLPGAACFLACDIANMVEGGDHTVVLGSVLAADTVDGPPLTYHARAFGTHTPLATSGSS